MEFIDFKNYPRFFRRDGTPYKSALEWAEDTTDENRIVKQDSLKNGLWVSTVHLGLDHNFLMQGPPLIFETMVFKKRDSLYQERYSTEEEAVKGHDRVVKEFSKYYSFGSLLRRLRRNLFEQKNQD